MINISRNEFGWYGCYNHSNQYLWADGLLHQGCWESKVSNGYFYYKQDLVDVINRYENENRR